MERRAFILAAAGSLLAAPLAGEGQQAGVVRIGYLPANLEAFRQGLRDIGYLVGQNAVIEARHADGASERLPGFAAELVRLIPRSRSRHSSAR